MDSIILRNITVALQDAPEQSTLDDIKFSAHLIIGDIVHETTAEVRRHEADNIWKWSEVFVVPVVYPQFNLGIIKIDADGARTHHGAVEIIMDQIELHASKQETHIVVQTSKDFLQMSFTAYSSTSNLAKGPSPPDVLSVAKAMGCDSLVALLTQIVVSDDAFMNPDLGLLFTIYTAIIRLPDEGTHKPRALGLLANIYLARYDKFSAMMGKNAERYPMFVLYSKGVDKAISMLDAALALASADHPKRPWMLLTLCMCLQRNLVLQTSNEGQLRTTALKMSKLLPHMLDDEPKKPIFCSYLGEVLGRCFAASQSLSDLDLSISLHEDAVRLTATASPYKIAFLVDLVASLQERVWLHRRAEDENQLVVLQEDLLALVPADFPGRLLILRNLGHAFFVRFQDFGDVESIEKSIRMYEEALTFLPDGHPERPSILNNLAASLSVRLQGPNSLPNLRRAVDFVLQAIHLAPTNDPIWFQFIVNLGNSVLALFEADSWDIEKFKAYNQVVLDGMESSNDNDLVILMSNFKKFTHKVNFKGLSDDAIVQTLVPLFKSTINVLPDHSHTKAFLLFNLGCSLSTIFDRGRSRQLLDHSVDLLENAISLCPEDPVWTSTLGSIYLSRFIHFHDQHDWLMAELRSLHSTLQILPSDPVERQIILRNFGSLLFQRFHKTGDMDFLDRCIEVYRDIFRDVDAVSQASWVLSDGAAALFHRFRVVGMKEDIDEAISQQERLVAGVQTDKQKAVETMFELSKLLFFRFHHFCKMDDLDRAFAYLEDSAILPSSENLDAPSRFQGYYDDMSEHFKSFSGNQDVDVCVKEVTLIATQQNALQPKTILRIHNIGMFLSIRLPHLNGLDVVTKQALDSFESSIKLFTDNRVDKGLWLSMLGDLSLRMFAQSRNKRDLDKAVSLGEDAIRLHRADAMISRKARQFLFILNLTISLHQRFASSRDLADLNRSIYILEDASMICPQDDSNKHRLLFALGISLVNRYDLLGDVFDLNKAAHALQEAVVLAPDDDPKYYMLEQNIGSLFQRRLKISGNPQDAQIAIETLELSMQTLPKGSLERLDSMVAYSKALQSRFWYFRAKEDLDKAIKMLADVLSQLPTNSHRRAGVLHDLGSAFAQLFVQLGEVDDINRSISFLMQAKDLMSKDEPEFYMLLFDLGRWLPTRYERLHDKKDLEDADEVLRQASTLPAAPYMWRFRAASLRSYWTQNFLGKGGSGVVDLDGYKDALALLPKIAWLGMSIQSRQWHLVEAGDVVLDAVAAAIECGRYELALEWLEAGRSVTWGQLIELRTPVNVLQDTHPALAARFSHLSMALGEMESSQPTSPKISSQEYNNSEPPMIAPSHRYHDLADERDKLLQHIRTLDGFQDFLFPKSFSDLLEADFKGPVITLNINKFRCDALVLTSDKRILHIPLDRFSACDAHEMMKTLKGLLKSRTVLRGDEHRGPRKSPFARRGHANPEGEFRDILAKLWTCVAKPIIDEMGLTAQSDDPDGALPRIWWCVTGPMTLLPIHAAGLYGSDNPAKSKCKLSDFAVSSYIPSLSALMRCCQPRQIRKKKLLAVALPIESALPCTQTEMEIVQKHDVVFPVECLIESSATYENVVRGLENAGWAHFACHGIQNFDDPTQSALLVSGDKKLTLSDLSKLSLPHAELAFLSACQTATGDELLPEEAVHLAAGMLLAGYQGVVGTMWSIPDVEGPKITNEFYTRILVDGVPDPAQAAYALHASVQALQDNSDGRPSFFSWVPFVHYGL